MYSFPIDNSTVIYLSLQHVPCSVVKLHGIKNISDQTAISLISISLGSLKYAFSEYILEFLLEKQPLKRKLNSHF